MTDIPQHHKQIAKHLREWFGDPASVKVYRDSSGNNPIPIGAFGPKQRCLYSAVGVCDRRLPVPAGMYEWAAMGKYAWLPNAIASSLYWLNGRAFESWPIVCEDVIRHNARSTYRHLAFLPSQLKLMLPRIANVQWLLGLPLKESEIGLDQSELEIRMRDRYAEWA